MREKVMQVLLVAPDAEEREILTAVLRGAGLAVGGSGSLGRVAAKWWERPSDLVVVADYDSDALLPHLGDLRRVTQVPCLLILEKPGEARLCQLLQAGADLILSRPVSPRVFITYIRVLLRRAQAVPPFALPRLDLPEIQLNPDTRTVTIPGQEPRRLTQLEFRLLYALMMHREQVVPLDVIVERVWGYTGQGNRELVRGLVSRLRRKVEPDPGAPRFIQNVPGVGYRFSLE